MPHQDRTDRSGDDRIGPRRPCGHLGHFRRRQHAAYAEPHGGPAAAAAARTHRRPGVGHLPTVVLHRTAGATPLDETEASVIDMAAVLGRGRGSDVFKKITCLIEVSRQIRKPRCSLGVPATLPGVSSGCMIARCTLDPRRRCGRLVCRPLCNRFDTDLGAHPDSLTALFLPTMQLPPQQQFRAFFPVLLPPRPYPILCPETLVYQRTSAPPAASTSAQSPTPRRGRRPYDRTGLKCSVCGTTETPEWRSGPLYASALISTSF